MNYLVRVEDGFSVIPDTPHNRNANPGAVAAPIDYRLEDSHLWVFEPVTANLRRKTNAELCAEARRPVIVEIKRQAAERIVSLYPTTTQMNLSAAVEVLDGQSIYRLARNQVLLANQLLLLSPGTIELNAVADDATDIAELYRYVTNLVGEEFPPTAVALVQGALNAHAIEIKAIRTASDLLEDTLNSLGDDLDAIALFFETVGDDGNWPDFSSGVNNV